MNIFGIGGAELILIIIIMLMVAGPKRMIHWSYILGQYMAKLQKMWVQVAAMIQQEMDDAGVDIQVPKEMPNRQSLNKMAQDTLKSYAEPIESVRQEMRDDMRQLNKDIDMSEPRAVATRGRKGAGREAVAAQETVEKQQQAVAATLGAWGQANTTPPSASTNNSDDSQPQPSNGNQPETSDDLGSWSNPQRDE
jgi:Sec-independent protein translocase protein TatA